MEGKNGPFFVKIDEFKDIVETLKQIKGKVDEANKILDKLNTLKAKEESEIEDWKQQIDDVSRRVNTIQSSLFDQ